MNKLKLVVAAAALLCGAGVNAQTVYSHDFSADAFITSDQTIGTSFTSAAGYGLATFQVRSWNSLDGDNYYIDIFKLQVNGQQIFAGTWNMGGGGADRIFQAPTGATVDHQGQLLNVTLPVALVNGVNTISYSYESPYWFEGSSRSGHQDLGDEGWQLGNVNVNYVSPVPEPETYAMMLAGLAVTGALARRRAKRKVA